MKNRLVGLLLAVMVALGLVATTGLGAAGQASAATVQDTGTKVFVGFTKGETKQLAQSGVAGVVDHPAVHPYFYGSVDSKTRFKRVYVPGRGYTTYATANLLVREAASHNGNVWISFNKTGKRPFTLWTRWK
ncbi:hypothetical protein L5G28_01120 [Gordonia sp. HY285]|uniref:Uncharacterized protein n=1 Tax=Gordonia liuliyuniae TaxID=2911517 RepID=A0ABS9IPB6_9ACTN|nr:hypothetical protein [Gordonia liuliyuniae]MCF8587409.1 hypothetical protein [Gordonia liuliyuniae]MCF8608766.1 hypothetical protein [Gordonia liuliyuniae]